MINIINMISQTLRSTINMREAYNNVRIMINMISMYTLTMWTLGKPFVVTSFSPSDMSEHSKLIQNQLKILELHSQSKQLENRVTDALG